MRPLQELLKDFCGYVCVYVPLSASVSGTEEPFWTDSVTKLVRLGHWRSYTGCPSCSESNSRWHWWCSQSTHAAALTTSPIQCRHVTVIRDGLDSTLRPVLTILFHGQERNSATEPSLWPDQLYGTVYRQQLWSRQLVFVQAQAQNSFLPSVLLTNYVVLCILQTFVMHSRSGAE